MSVMNLSITCNVKLTCTSESNERLRVLIPMLRSRSADFFSSFSFGQSLSPSFLVRNTFHLNYFNQAEVLFPIQIAFVNFAIRLTAHFFTFIQARFCVLILSSFTKHKYFSNQSN